MKKRSKHFDKKFYPYVIQIGANKEVLYVNYASDIVKSFNKFLHRHPHIRNSILRKDLFDDNLYFTNSKRADRATRRLIQNLESQGFEVIAGGPLHNNYWRVYVIEIDGNDRHLYVGETNYPIEKRFQQHIYQFNSARIFKKYDCFELAMQHAKHLPRLLNKEESLQAEASMARQLRAEGYKVEGGH